MEEKNISTTEEATEVLLDGETKVTEAELPLDRNVKLMSPMQMVIRRFFRS